MVLALAAKENGLFGTNPQKINKWLILGNYENLETMLQVVVVLLWQHDDQLKNGLPFI